MLEPNNQSPWPLVHHRNQIQVHSIWDSIQGEGLFTGHPATFIRLAGCNLQCPLCDTQYTDHAKNWDSPAGLALHLLGLGRPLVVITGGEPFRQKVEPLLVELDKLSITAQVETNGILVRPVPENARVICSPKTNKVSDACAEHVDAWKYVLDANHVDAVDGLPTRALGMSGAPARPTNDNRVYVQPLDVDDDLENARHTAAAVESCMKYGWVLCLQVHKIVGLD